jgi:hypothetical protein
MLTSIPGGGTLALVGTVQPPPAASQLRLRLKQLDLASWAEFVPVAARVTGIAEADLNLNEPLAADVPARVQGSLAVSQPSVAAGRQELLGARRVGAQGFELRWPTRLVVKRVLLSEPRGTIERDRAGNFPLTALLARPRPGRATAPPAVEPAKTPAGPPLAVEVGEIAVQDGRLTWRDETVSPAAVLAISNLDAMTPAAAGRCAGHWACEWPCGPRVAVWCRPRGAWVWIQ